MPITKSHCKKENAWMIHCYLNVYYDLLNKVVSTMGSLHIIGCAEISRT